jgi:transposase
MSEHTTDEDLSRDEQPGAAQTRAAQAAPGKRRRYSAKFRAEAVAAALDPKAPAMATVARGLGIELSLLRNWIRSAKIHEQREDHARAVRAAMAAGRSQAPPDTSVPAALPAGFVPIGPQALAAPPEDIRVRFNRGTTEVSVAWPVSAAAQCGAWLRELMQ